MFFGEQCRATPASNTGSERREMNNADFPIDGLGVTESCFIPGCDLYLDLTRCVY